MKTKNTNDKHHKITAESDEKSTRDKSIDESLNEVFKEITPQKYHESLEKDLKEWINAPPEGRELL